MIRRGRHYTALSEEHQHLAVLLLGMRINNWLRIRDWGSVVRDMQRMLAELSDAPQAGLLRTESYWMGRNFIEIQYWQDITKLDEYVHNGAMSHLTAWKNYAARTKNRDSVGFYHEIYIVGETPLEAVYSNMPPVGLAAAVGQLEAVTHRTNGREKLDRYRRELKDAHEEEPKSRRSESQPEP
ncbi:monooxygenase family protein [Streptomyces sp. 3211]|uniref:monooxygenase family protein n=1 Tax=Streptomyces sp. 3211 TaxID=1964449 RepID=UPI0013315972|nr:DUF4188 domain-containing protein [Streptomyces sp. 3211]